MRRVFFAAIISILAFCLVAAGPPVYYSSQDALNKIFSSADSLVELTYENNPPAEWITIVNGITIPAAKHMTFPMPLTPMGDHDQVAFNISCTTWPDTLWYQVVASNSPTDSLTVFNFGTTEAPNYLRYIVAADFQAEVTSACEYLDNAFTETWHPTGTDFNPSVGSYTFPVKDIAGLYTGAKYTGLRVGADVNSAIVGLKIIQELK